MTTPRTPSRIPSRVRVPVERQKRIKVHTCISEDLERSFLAWCNRNGHSISEGVRVSLEAMLEADKRARRRAESAGSVASLGE